MSDDQQIDAVPTPVPGATLRITQIRSTIGRPKDQGLTIRAIGLRRINHTVERADSASMRGMVTKVRHLVEVEEVSADAAGRERPPAKRRGLAPNFPPRATE